jgi:hypothetical protein
MADWWARHMRQRTPDKLLNFVKAEKGQDAKQKHDRGLVVSRLFV